LQDLAVLDKKDKVQGGTLSVHPKWIAPSPGCVNINVDVAVAKESVGGAVAAVCQSEEGTFLGAAFLTIQGINDPSMLEAIACRNQQSGAGLCGHI
jgi:hypothetical protein